MTSETVVRSLKVLVAEVKGLRDDIDTTRSEFLEFRDSIEDNITFIKNMGDFTEEMRNIMISVIEKRDASQETIQEDLEDKVEEIMEKFLHQIRLIVTTEKSVVEVLEKNPEIIDKDVSDLLYRDIPER